MPAVLKIIEQAMQEIGVLGSGETPSADDAALCLEALNDIIDAWRLESLYVFATTEITYSLPAATASRTIGPSLNIDVARPVRFERGCFVRVGGIDTPLEFVPRAEFNAIAQKTLAGSWPRVAFYDDTYPTGVVHFYPQGACELHLVAQIPLTAFATVATAIALPPAYKRALALTLAEEVAAKFQVTLQPATVRKAKSARRIIKRSNVEVPQLHVGGTMPAEYDILVE